MDELIIQGQWWLLLVVPVATGIFALCGSWAGSYFGRSTEHRQWLRNQKQEAYSEFIRLTATLPIDKTEQVERYNYYSSVMLAYTRIQVLGSKQVMEQATALHSSLAPYLRTGAPENFPRSSDIATALDGTLKAIRKDLRVKDGTL